MNTKKLTIEEIENLLATEDFSEEQIKRIEALGITVENFIDEFNDAGTLSGLEDDEEFMTINDFIAHLEEMQKHELNSEYGQEVTNELIVKEENAILSNFSGFVGNMNRPEILTNIKDKKQIYNLGKHVDKLLNNCEGLEIEIDKILIKKYQKPLENPIIDVLTGEIITDTKTTMSVVIVDTKGVSYATGSKSFGWELINCIDTFGDEIKGMKIKIIKTLRTGAKNKSLDFEIV